jgi:hypothetical protein
MTNEKPKLNTSRDFEMYQMFGSPDINKKAYEAEIEQKCELCHDVVDELNENNLCTHCQLDMDINEQEQKNDID